MPPLPAVPPDDVDTLVASSGSTCLHTGHRLDSRLSHLKTQQRWKLLLQHGILTPRSPTAISSKHMEQRSTSCPSLVPPKAQACISSSASSCAERAGTCRRPCSSAMRSSHSLKAVAAAPPNPPSNNSGGGNPAAPAVSPVGVATPVTPGLSSRRSAPTPPPPSPSPPDADSSLEEAANAAFRCANLRRITSSKLGRERVYHGPHASKTLERCAHTTAVSHCVRGGRRTTCWRHRCSCNRRGGAIRCHSGTAEAKAELRIRCSSSPPGKPSMLVLMTAVAAGTLGEPPM